MASIGRVKIEWSGFQGGPGLTVLHFGSPDLATFGQAEANDAVAKADALIQALKPYTPYQSAMKTMPDVEALDVATGALQSVYNTTPAAATVSTGTLGTKFTAASGAVITWKTNTVKNRRRMRGRSFLVPLSINIVEQNGTLDPTFTAALNTAATALRATGSVTRLQVYARPVKDFTIPGTDVSYTFNGGKAGEVIGHVIPDKVAVLRSRRD